MTLPRNAAIFSPAGPRSTLNTVPDGGPVASPGAVGSSSVMALVSAGRPAPVITEPKYTGWTVARLL